MDKTYRFDDNCYATEVDATGDITLSAVNSMTLLRQDGSSIDIANYVRKYAPQYGIGGLFPYHRTGYP